MLTFEEFFLKKKIDLTQFETAEPGLFAEFSRHYPLMGEKSFDHTKKYHFNYLRRTFPLPVIAKPHPVQAEDISEMAVQGIAVAAAQNLNDAIERPKFKEDHLVELSEPGISEKDISLAEAENIILETAPETEISKPAFKPRFNPKNIPKPKEEATPEVDAVTANAEAAAKPAFKPRFNPKNIPKTTAESTEAENTETTAAPAKPAFKPKFNVQNIKKEAVKTASETDAPSQEPAAENTDSENVLQSYEDQAELKPAFKPRFNPKNIPKQVAEPEANSFSEQKEAPADQTLPAGNQTVKTVSEQEQTDNPNPDAATAQPAEKPVYKPRFQMKNIKKPQSDQE